MYESVQQCSKMKNKFKRGLNDADYMHLGSKSLQINLPSNSPYAVGGIKHFGGEKDRFAGIDQNPRIPLNL